MLVALEDGCSVLYHTEGEAANYPRHMAARIDPACDALSVMAVMMLPPCKEGRNRGMEGGRERSLRGSRGRLAPPPPVPNAEKHGFVSPQSGCWRLSQADTRVGLSHLPAVDPMTPGYHAASSLHQNWLEGVLGPPRRRIGTRSTIPGESPPGRCASEAGSACQERPSREPKFRSPGTRGAYKSRGTSRGRSRRDSPSWPLSRSLLFVSADRPKPVFPCLGGFQFFFGGGGQGTERARKMKVSADEVLLGSGGGKTTPRSPIRGG